MTTSKTYSIEYYTLVWDSEGEEPRYLCYGGSNYWWSKQCPTETWGFTPDQVRGIINHANREVLNAPLKDVHVAKITQTLVVMRTDPK